VKRFVYPQEFKKRPRCLWDIYFLPFASL